jgi:hypothetical protein
MGNPGKKKRGKKYKRNYLISSSCSSNKGLLISRIYRELKKLKKKKKSTSL